MTSLTHDSAPRDFEALADALVGRRAELPKRLAQVAEYALAHPDEIAFGTAASIAAAARTNPSTLVRFARAIGYSGFSDLQAVFRSRLKARFPEYRDRLAALAPAGGQTSEAERLVSGFAGCAVESLAALQQSVQPEDFSRAADILAGAKVIHLLGLRRAFPVACYLAYGLGKLQLRARLVDHLGALAPEQGAAIGPEDALVAVSFTPYTPTTVEVANAAAARGVPVVALTDSPFSPLAPAAAVRFDVAEADFGGFRSLSASLALAMALAVAVGARKNAG